MKSKVGRLGVIGLCAAAALNVHCHSARSRTGQGYQYHNRALKRNLEAGQTCDAHVRLAKNDPLAFLRSCRDQYLADVRDYRCLFTMRERNGGTLSSEQGIRILFREDPFSVKMEWVKNPQRAAQIVYVAGRWVDRGRELALIKPSGMLGWLVPAGVKRHIHATTVMAQSRRPIDQFGFRNTLELIIKYCEAAEGEADFALEYVGRDMLGDRECLVLERRLPRASEGSMYPDRLLVTFIDCEWLVPIGSYSYLDDAGKKLQGSYVLTEVEFNVGLSDGDF